MVGHLGPISSYLIFSFAVDLALQIIESLGVHKLDNPTLSSTMSPEFVQGFLDRECARRIFWLIHFIDLMSNIYFKRSMPLKDNELLRMPMDETSFELALHSTLPGILELPSVLFVNTNVNTRIFVSPGS
jgi:hypothetical protein